MTVIEMGIKRLFINLLAVSAWGCLPGLRSADDSERLAAMVKDEARPALQRLEASDPAVRESACRALAVSAEHLRRLGDAETAEQYVRWIVERYDREDDAGVRYAIASLCAPVMGRGGSPETLAFLRRRLATGDLAGPAALSLADLEPPDAYDLISPLASHPLPAARADAALALTVLGDPRGRAVVREIVEEMRSPAWPRQVWGVPLAAARESLAARASQVFGTGQ